MNMPSDSKDDSDEKGLKASILLNFYKDKDISRHIKIVDKLPVNIEKGEIFFLKNCTLEIVRNNDGKIWNAKSGNPKKLYDSNGSIVHLQDDGQYIRKIRGGRQWTHDVLSHNTEIFQIRFHYAINVNDETFSRRLAEITQLQPEVNRPAPAVIVEFLDAQNRKRKLKPSGKASSHKPTFIAPSPPALKPTLISDFDKFPGISTNGESCAKLEDIQVNPLNSLEAILEDIDELTKSLKETSISDSKFDSTGIYPPHKLARQAGDSQSKEMLLSLNSEELNAAIRDEDLDPIFREVLKNPDKFNDEYCQYENINIDKWRILGPVLSINFNGSILQVATEGLKAKASEWSKICKSPQTITRIHSRPYLCRLVQPENEKTIGFIVMFSIVNHSQENCVIKVKLLNGTPINDLIPLPLRCQLEVVMDDGRSITTGEIVTLKKLNQYASENLYIDIRSCNKEDFPRMIVNVMNP